METQREDIYTRVTNQIIEAIEAGAKSDGRMPWHVTDGDRFSPTNAASGKPYRGINVLSLWVAAEARGYVTGIWATYKQWRELGAQVRKGEKSSLVVFWSVTDGDEPEDGETDRKSNRRFFAKGYPVFNAAQVDGYTVPETPRLPEAERIAWAEAFFGSLGANIRHGGTRAFYNRVSDFIQVPEFEAFRDAVAYYSVLAHEATHWTGAKGRLERDLSGRFGSNAYAAEELVAELGAAFVCASLRLTVEPRADHADYVASWLEVLRSDKRAIFTAASKAQEAVDWMSERNGEDLRFNRAGCICRPLMSEEMMSAKIVSCRIGPFPRPMPEGLSDPMPSVEVTLDDGTTKTLFTFYPDELSFEESEFIGLTEEEARQLRHMKDVSYLRS